MARTVDKEQKRRDIALACLELVLEKNLDEIKIIDLAKAADIGKGTFYEYFRNKNELLFELASILIEQHSKDLEQQLRQKSSIKERVQTFATFFYEQKYEPMRTIYKKFIATSLLEDDVSMHEFNKATHKRYIEWFEAIIHEAIERGELKMEAAALVRGIFAVGDGIFLQNAICALEANTQEDLTRFIENLFKVLEL